MSERASGEMHGVDVRCVGVSRVYRVEGEEVQALRGVDLAVPAGATLAVQGRSGSGKSTLLTLLAGLQRPTAGSLLVGDDDLAAASERHLLRLRGSVIACVVQNPGRNLLPYGTAEDNIRFARRPVRAIVREHLPPPSELLSRLGLEGCIGRQVATLSGGEQQRVAIAVGLARAPDLLLLDEPTSQLDATNRDHVVELLSRVGRDFGSTVIAVTHDPAVADALDRRVEIEDGRLR